MDLRAIYFSPEEQQPSYILFLNDMRSPNTAHVMPVARASLADVLLVFLAAERVERYRDVVDDYAWSKCFRKGGPLEWYNDTDCGVGSVREVTSLLDRMQQLLQEWERIPNALTLF